MTHEEYTQELRELRAFHSEKEREYSKIAHKHEAEVWRLDKKIYEEETKITEGAIVSIWEENRKWDSKVGDSVITNKCAYYMKVTAINPKRDGEWIELTGYKLNANGKPGQLFKRTQYSSF